MFGTMLTTQQQCDQNASNVLGFRTDLRVYASPGNLEKTMYAGTVAKKVIEYYVNYFGIPYPLPKLGKNYSISRWALVQR